MRSIPFWDDKSHFGALTPESPLTLSHDSQPGHPAIPSPDVTKSIVHQPQSSSCWLASPRASSSLSVPSSGERDLPHRSSAPHPRTEGLQGALLGGLFSFLPDGSGALPLFLLLKWSGMSPPSFQPTRCGQGSVVPHSLGMGQVSEPARGRYGGVGTQQAPRCQSSFAALRLHECRKAPYLYLILRLNFPSL